MNNILNKIRKLYKEKKFVNILKIIQTLKEKNGDNLNPELLVYEGICIQLSNNEDYELDDAKKSFQTALNIDSDFEHALIELAYYYFNIEDDYEKALPLFLKALQINDTKYKEIVDGLKDINEEISITQAEFVKDKSKLNLKRSLANDPQLRDFIYDYFSLKSEKKNYRH